MILDYASEPRAIRSILERAGESDQGKLGTIREGSAAGVKGEEEA